MTFSANGKHLLGGGWHGVRVWQVQDGQHIATLQAGNISCLALSRDGNWIAAGAAGTWTGKVLVWDAKTYEKVFSHTMENLVCHVSGVDFSPDSSRLVSASDNHTAAVWDMTTRKQVHTLRDKDWVSAVKYSPQGDRIATATRNSVRVWDSNDATLVADIKVTVAPLYNTSLLWVDNDLFVVSEGAVQRLESSTGSTLSEWPVPDTSDYSCVALPKHGKFIACSGEYTVSFWDTSTYSLIGQIQYTRLVYPIVSIAFSQDDRFLAISSRDGKIFFKDLKDGLTASYSLVSIVYWRTRWTRKLIPLFFRLHSLRALPLPCSIHGNTTASETQKHR